MGQSPNYPKFPSPSKAVWSPPDLPSVEHVHLCSSLGLETRQMLLYPRCAAPGTQSLQTLARFQVPAVLICVSCKHRVRSLSALGKWPGPSRLMEFLPVSYHL